MIYTLTLNPSIDYHMDPMSLNFGKTNRSRCETYTYGGKGINVSVVLNRLGVDTVALGFVGGYTGEEIRLYATTSGGSNEYIGNPYPEGEGELTSVLNTILNVLDDIIM